MPRLYQGSFGSGELAPGLWGRVDLDRFASALRICRNMFPLAEGGVTKRPGLEFVGFGIESLTGDMRLIPFKFNNEQTYIVVAQPDGLFFIKDGGVILNANATSGTYAMGQDGNGVYITDTSNSLITDGYGVAGQPIFITSGGFDEVEGRWVKCASSPTPAAGTIYVEDYVSGDALATSGWTGAGAPLFASPYEATTNWFASVDVTELDYTQANDTLYVSHPDEETKVITRTSDTAWTIADFSPDPSVSAPSVAEDTLTGALYDNVTLTKPSGADSIDYAICAIDNDTYEESLATIVTVSSINESAMAPPTSGGFGAALGITWASGADRYRIYKAVGGIYGLVGQAEGTSGTLYFTDVGFTPNLAIAPPLEVNPEFNATDEYPGAVELFQQRIWFGRTNTELRDIYASRSGSFSSFSTTTVSTDDDPISQKIAARSVHEVRYFVPLRDLVILTSDGEWGFDSGDVGVLTPSAGLIAQSFWGSARVKPAMVGDSAVFVEKSGRTLRDLAFSLQNDGFASSNLSLLAQHLFQDRQIVSICYAENPYHILFCVMSDGRAVSCTYVRDQQIFAWARHDTSGTFLDCASITEDGRDNIYVTVERESGSGANIVRHRQVERMVMTEPAYIDRGLYLDNGMEWGVPTSSDNDGTATAMRVLSVSGTVELQLKLPDTVPDDTQILFKAAAGSQSEVLDGLSFQVVATGNPAGGRDYYRFYRQLNNSTSPREQMDWERILPQNIIEDGTSGYYREGVGSLTKAHHLVYRGGSVAVRADDSYHESQQVSEGGARTFSLTQEAGVVQAGEVYTAAIETLDIDSVQNPVTGQPMQIGEILLRFGLAHQYTFGRDRDTLAERTVAQLATEDAWDYQIGGVQGVTSQITFPAWKRRGRVVMRSSDPFPLQLSAIVPVVEVGDFDE